jgi:hypothetical protein
MTPAPISQQLGRANVARTARGVLAAERGRGEEEHRSDEAAHGRAEQRVVRLGEPHLAQQVSGGISERRDRPVDVSGVDPHVPGALARLLAAARAPASPHEHREARGDQREPDAHARR